MLAISSAAVRAAWIALGSIEIALCWSLFLATARVILPVQMAWRRKLGAIAWFGGSLIVSGVIIARLTVSPTALFEADYTYDIVTFSILLSLELHLFIMNAAYVNLLSFIKKTTTGFMNTTAVGNSETGRSLHSGLFRQPKLRGSIHNRLTTLAQGNADNTSLRSFDSQAIMVTRSVAVDERQPSQSSAEGEHI
ncbi:hypothetical protein LTR85_000555 [Meristemomyces frigidus]|nr:hypothetical protein LTR85_000555 [Meristemomyces frigidus]